MNNHLKGFLIALALHLGLLLLLQKPNVAEAWNEDELIDIQTVELPEEKPQPTPPVPKVTPPKPQPKTPPKVMPPAPKELEDPALEDIVEKKKPVEKAAEVVKKVEESKPTKAVAAVATGPKTVESSLVSTNVKVRGNMKPVYPSFAKKAGIEGWVVVRVLVSIKGKVLQVKIVEVEGHNKFGAAVQKVAQKWRFRPPILKGERVQMWYNKKIVFRLQD